MRTVVRSPMSGGLLYPLLYPLLLGVAGGLFIGFSIRKLSSLIALIFGILVFVVNILGLIRILDLEIGIPSLQNLIDLLFGFLPVSQPELHQQLRGLLPFLSQIPFIGGFALGLTLGFKFA